MPVGFENRIPIIFLSVHIFFNYWATCTDITGGTCKVGDEITDSLVNGKATAADCEAECRKGEMKSTGCCLFDTEAPDAYVCAFYKGGLFEESNQDTKASQCNFFNTYFIWHIKIKSQ